MTMYMQVIGIVSEFNLGGVARTSHPSVLCFSGGVDSILGPLSKTVFEGINCFKKTTCIQYPSATRYKANTFVSLYKPFNTV